jgi:hypothetical protein
VKELMFVGSFSPRVSLFPRGCNDFLGPLPLIRLLSLLFLSEFVTSSIFFFHSIKTGRKRIDQQTFIHHLSSPPSKKPQLHPRSRSSRPRADILSDGTLRTRGVGEIVLQSSFEGDCVWSG